MTASDLLREKIDTLKNAITEISVENLDEKTRISAELVIIDEVEKVSKDEILMTKYDFSSAITLLETHDFVIENLSKIISDIKNVIEVKQELNLPELALATAQKETFDSFINQLSSLKNSLTEKLTELTKDDRNKRKIQNLEDLMAILENPGSRKYVTVDMVDTFYEEFDILNKPLSEVKLLLKGFYNTRNLRNRKNREKADIYEVIALYKEFFSDNRLLEDLIKVHQEEITTYIDLDNTRDILAFFTDKKIINKFRRTALLKVSLFGKIEKIKEVYDQIMNRDPNSLDLYFEDDLATVWVCYNNHSRKKPFRVSREKDGTGDEDRLYSKCHTVTLDEFWENVDLLNQNSNLFSDKYDVGNFGAHLRAKRIPTEQVKNYTSLLNLVTGPGDFRKNIGLCRIFGFGTIHKIPVSTLEYGDIEEKIHLAIELGLLNPPITQEYKVMEASILKTEEFERNMDKQNLVNQSIRNYFQRYSSKLSGNSINEYAYLFYKLLTLGQENFYRDFFSDVKAGQADPCFLADAKKNNDIDDIVMNNFITEWYSEFVPNYDEYDEIIEEANSTSKKDGFDQTTYFNQDILNEELIVNLEENYCVNDILKQGEQEIEIKNQFVYVFDDRIISRYKVLRNASILKSYYGVLDENMLIASIVRNSYLDENAFDIISDIVREGKKK